MSSDNAELAAQFLRAGKLFENYRASRCRMLDPHRGQGRVLALLAENPEISQKKLSYLLDMRNQSLSELLSKLEKAGLITRVPSEEDRRGMNIRLTEEGALLARQTEEKKDDSGRIFECLSASDRRKLSELLDALTDELEDRLDYDDDNGRHRGEHHHHDSHHHRAEPPEKKSGEADNITEIRKVI